MLLKWELPLRIPAAAIGLPTMGAEVISVEKAEDGPELSRTGPHYRLLGAIHPIDPAAQDILFQVYLPIEWNGKIVQYGGDGMDGHLNPLRLLTFGWNVTGPYPVRDGYLMVSSDGGHETDPENGADASWALNKETFENFCYAQLKKTRDVAVFLAKLAYGRSVRRVYFMGGSNGGRECMKAIQKFPSDYDGAVCFYPVLYWVSKTIQDARISDDLQRLGQKGWISPRLFDKIQEVILDCCDGDDGLCDGLICDYERARDRQGQIREALEKFLNEDQLAVLDSFARPLDMRLSMGYGETVLPGYSIYQGAAPFFMRKSLIGDEGMDGSVMGGANRNVISCMVRRDATFDTRGFAYTNYAEEIAEASRLLDAYGPEQLADFAGRGGKVLLVQGLADPLVAPDGTIRFYETLRKHFGQEELDEFLRFYLIPGFGHGISDLFDLDTDLLPVLDAWVEKGEAPDELVVTDCSKGHRRRTRPLYPYPEFSMYNGEGDPDRAESFHRSGVQAGLTTSHYMEKYGM